MGSNPCVHLHLVDAKGPVVVLFDFQAKATRPVPCWSLRGERLGQVDEFGCVQLIVS